MTKLEKKFVNSKKHGLRNIELIERLGKVLNINSIENAIEIGCGAGFLAAHLNKKYNINITAVDVDPEQIELAKKHQKERENLKFIVEDATKLKSSENQKYDLAISTFVLHHIPNWNNALNEIKRVLKSDGFYFFYDLTYPNILAKIFKPILKNYGIYTAKDITDYLEKNNFQILHKEKSGNAPFKNYSMVLQKS
jgi:ubiquinone/menaquinone biosynthesis C-methylase UbiE